MRASSKSQYLTIDKNIGKQHRITSPYGNNNSRRPTSYGYVSPSTGEFTKWQNTDSVNIDHIYPQKLIKKDMADKNLTAMNRTKLLNFKSNLEEIPASTNQSKSDKLAGEIKKIKYKNNYYTPHAKYIDQLTLKQGFNQKSITIRISTCDGLNTLQDDII